MKRTFSYCFILAFAIAFFPFSAGAAVVCPGGSEVPDVPGFVGYAANKIVIKFNPSVLQSFDKKKIPQGRTGIPSLDQMGKRFGVISIRPQFPGSRQKIYRGRVVDLSGWHKIKFANATDVISAVKEYKAIPGVVDAQPVSIHTVYATPDEQFYDQQWHLPKIEAPAAWDIETGNSDIIVAILDTGVRYFAKDLGGVNASLSTPTDINGNVWINSAEKGGSGGVDDDGNGYVDDWVGYDFVEDTAIPDYPCYPGEDCGTKDNDPRDFHGHGTHCAGNVAAMNNNGEAVASPSGGWGNGTLEASGNGVKVMSLRIGWSAIYLIFFEIGLVEMDYAAEALYYAADNGARIASCSWGSENTGGLGDAIDYFLASGGLIFKAAGNGNTETPDYMGGREDIINVAATDDNDCKASFSNFGTWVDISAPGVNIWSLYHNKYDPEEDYVTNMDGTSMAAPLTASVAALIWSQNPGLSTQQVKQRLFDSADAIDDLGCNASYVGKLGAGRINAYEAVKIKDEGDADFNGDGYTDILWRHSTSGQDVIWLMDGTSLNSYVWLDTVGDTDWKIIELADFDTDSDPDILWRNNSSGQIVIWVMNGTSLNSYAWLDTVGDTNWEIADVADFDNDNDTDILWHNSSTGQNVIWVMDGTSLDSYVWLGTVGDTNWKIFAVADFDTDGDPDILWRHGTTGQNVIWLMDGTSLDSYAWLDTVADTNWKINDTADFDTDGDPDILWRHATTGQNVIWVMNGTSLNSYAWLDTVADTGWEIADVADFDKDNDSDILWRHATTGQNVIWVMNGTSLDSYAWLDTVSDTNWEIQ